MNGILLIDKPAGMTSHDVVFRVRKILGQKKVGHAGTLDPMATGILVILVGKATKLSDYLLNKEKRYTAGILLGQETDTYDLEGTILRQCIPNVSQQNFIDVLKYFKGVQEQVPPMYSAIKQNGKKLYELARKGVEVQRQGRKIEILSLSLVSFDGKKAVVDVSCSKGTYIRSLAHDIGEKLGCGACLFSLRRTACGQFTEQMAVSLQQLETGSYPLLSTHSVLPFPSITVEGEVKRKIWNGTAVPLKEAYFSGKVKIFSPEGSFLCVAKAEPRPYGCFLQPESMFLEEG